MKDRENFIKPITLKIDKNIWTKFKDLVHRDTRLNDAICLLIYEFVNKGNKIIDLKNAK